MYESWLTEAFVLLGDLSTDQTQRKLLKFGSCMSDYSCLGYGIYRQRAGHDVWHGAQSAFDYYELQC
jgi:hypothetical protein